MQSEPTVIGNVTITEARQPAQKPEAEKPKERTDKEKVDWAAGREKAYRRMYPNAKPEDDDKKDAPKPGKKAETKTEEKPATPADEKAKPETKSAKEPADSGDGEGKAGEEKAQEQKPKLKPVKKEEAAPPVDYEKLATSVATATAKALKEDKANGTPKPEDDVPEARRRDLPAIEHLEKTNPKYKGKVEEYRKFAKAEADYVSKWEKENPGSKFDADADEHSEFYDKHEPDIDPDDVTDARVEIAADRKAKELSSRTEKEIEELRLERDIERSERDMPAFIGRNLAMVGSAMGEEVAKSISELKEGGSLEETDPAAHNTLMAVLPELNAQTLAAARIFGTEGRAYNGSDPVHQAVAKSALELETLLLEQGDDKLTDAQGRKFAKLDQWANMTKDQRAKHWTITADLMSAHLANNAAQKAEETYKTERAKVEKLAKAYGWQKSGESQTARKTETKERDEADEDSGKSRSPSTSTRSVIQPGASVSPQTTQDWGERMLNKMHRR